MRRDECVPRSIEGPLVIAPTTYRTGIDQLLHLLETERKNLAFVVLWLEN